MLKVSSAVARWFCGSPMSASAPRETESVHQAKQERDQGRQPARQRFALVKCFDGHQHDGQRDGCFHRRRSQREPSECTAGQREAVRKRERGDGPDQLALKPHQEQQRGNEQQVIDAAQDVFDTKQ